MSVSVIIPTLNEEVCIGETISVLREQKPYEIIVADGGSTDQTPQMAQDADQIVQGARGRAAQMNLGAAQATGDFLLFLHADCIPGEGALAQIERKLSRRSIIAGCYQMQVQSQGLLYRCIEYCATVRVKLTGIVYGDQGFFLRRSTFEAIGGFPEVRFMEDVKISLSLRKKGRMAVSSIPILVSPRRWEKTGIIRQTCRNWILTLLAATGIHPDSLAGYYPQVR